MIICDFRQKYRVLSNFHLSPVVYRGLVFPSVENAYQAAKLENEHDIEYANQMNEESRERVREDGWRKRAELLVLCSPREAKKLGDIINFRPKRDSNGSLNRILPKDWHERKRDIMKTLVRRKFQTGWEAQFLLDTGDAELIEGGWWHDTFWGVCLGEDFNTKRALDNFINYTGSINRGAISSLEQDELERRISKWKPCEKCGAPDFEKGNQLGKILMEVRADLRALYGQ